MSDPLTDGMKKLETAIKPFSYLRHLMNVLNISYKANIKITIEIDNEEEREKFKTGFGLMCIFINPEHFDTDKFRIFGFDVEFK